MVDRLFAEPALARVYDTVCPAHERADLGYYLPLVLDAPRVLDVGCGTGQLLHLARAAGHRATLIGVDPADAMLDVARARDDVEWILGGITDVPDTATFDLVVMTGHAFQVLLTDDDALTALVAVRDRLAPAGRFAFETRNPDVRPWEAWTPERPEVHAAPDGTTIRMTHDVTGVRGDLVTFTVTYDAAEWPAPQGSESTLRFLDRSHLQELVRRAGLTIVEQHGNWDRSPQTDASPEIITIAARA